MYKIIQKRKYWLGFSLIIAVIAAVALFTWKLNLGIDFTGGSYLEVSFLKDRPDITKIQEKLGSENLGGLVVQPIGDKNVVLRFKDVTEEKHQAILKDLNDMVSGNTEEKKDKTGTTTVIDLTKNIEEVRFDSVGPSIGQELARRSFNAMFFVLLGIIIYIAYSFRKVSKPVESWKYGASAIIALVHDAIIVLGIFAILGHFFDIEVNTPFVAALLTVMGFSVHDTIVVFDRIRENLPKSDEDFEGTVNTSLNQTLARSIITSGTVLLVLLSIYFWGGETIRDFALALLVGIFFGTYSSIFLASPLLVIWERFKNRD